MKPTAYVINLDRRQDRWLRTQALWSPWFDLIRVPAVDMPGNGALGCKLSHCQLAESMLHKEGFIIVLEDDNVETEWMLKIGLRCIEEAIGCIGDWKVVNCSPLLDLSPIGMPRAKLTATESPLFLRASYAHQTNFMLYNQSSLSLLQASLKSNLPIDIYIARNCQQIFVTARLLSTQDGSRSDIVEFSQQREWYERSAQMLETAMPEIEGRAMDGL